MRVLIFSVIFVAVISIYETIAPLFFGFYLLGACLYFFIMSRWDFSVRYIQWVGAYVVSVLGQYIGASLYAGHVIRWSYGVHIMVYEILVGICIYEITKKEKN